MNICQVANGLGSSGLLGFESLEMTVQLVLHFFEAKASQEHGSLFGKSPV